MSGVEGKAGKSGRYQWCYKHSGSSAGFRCAKPLHGTVRLAEGVFDRSDWKPSRITTRNPSQERDTADMVGFGSCAEETS